MISLYYDIATVLVVFICFLVFYKKGLLSSAMQLVTTVGAIVVGFIASSRLTPVVYEKFAYPRLLALVTNKLNAFYEGKTSGIGNGIIGSWVKDYLGGEGAQASVTEQAASIIEGSLANITNTVIKIVIFVVVALIASLLLKGLAKALKNANDVPVLGAVNKVLGGAFGIVIAAVILILISALISILCRFFTNDWLDEEVINSSFIFSYIYNNNPLIGQ